MAREKCHPSKHRKGCRKGRPLCRYRRAETQKYKRCSCSAYWFPHRAKSGLCGDPEKLSREIWGPSPEEVCNIDLTCVSSEEEPPF